VIVTDKLKSYAAAKQAILPGIEHRQSRYLNNRAENSHQPTRRRERRVPRFKSTHHAQRFLSSHGQIHNLFQLRRHLLTTTVPSRPGVMSPALPASPDHGATTAASV
jgi:putative transposase